jgi:hypothetical protein
MRQVMAGLLLAGVIDRIEGTWAVVEWAPSGEVRDVAAASLPQGIQEGDRILLHVRPHPAGDVTVAGRVSHQVLITLKGQIHLPSDAQLSAAFPYTAHIRLDPPPIQPTGHADPTTGTHEHGSTDIRL